MNTCKNFVDSIKNADFTGIFRLIMKEPSYVFDFAANFFLQLVASRSQVKCYVDKINNLLFFLITSAVIFQPFPSKILRIFFKFSLFFPVCVVMAILSLSCYLWWLSTMPQFILCYLGFFAS